MNKKKVVRLSESELHNIISESVMQILKENSEDEGHIGSYLSSIFGQGRKKGEEVGRNVKNAVRGAYNNVAQGVKTMHQNAMQDSSMASMESSMNKFKKDLEVYLKNGGQITRQLQSQVQGIMNMLNGYQKHY